MCWRLDYFAPGFVTVTVLTLAPDYRVGFGAGSALAVNYLSGSRRRLFLSLVSSITDQANTPTQLE